MTPSEQFPDITEAIRRHAIEISGLDPAAPFENSDPNALTDDLGFDSLDVLELVMGAEEAFRIDISDDEQMAFQRNCSIDNIVALIAKKKGLAE